jgi:sec-independent protein translocase protein TatA
MPNLRGSEWLILILLVVLLFGARRLPDAARGLGRSLRIFKAETKGLTESDKTDPPAVEDAASASSPPPPAVAEASAPETNKPSQT